MSKIISEITGKIDKFKTEIAADKDKIITELQESLTSAIASISVLTSDYLKHSLDDIRKLKHVQDFVAVIQVQTEPAPITGKRRGRKPGTKNKATTDEPKKDGRKGRKLSPEHLAKLRAAAKARWAKHKKSK
jgi:hypothetical protein